MTATGGVPRVSVGLPVYNAERYLPLAMDALLAQTFGDFELVVSDNGSTDGTEDIGRAYAATDDRVVYLRQEQNRGGAWNHNLVAELARAPYFKWAADDDLHEPEHLARCVEVLDADPSVVLASTWVDFIDEHGAPLGRHLVELYQTGSAHPHERFTELAVAWHGCFDQYGVVRTAALRSTPMLRRYAGSDRALLAELALYGRFHRVPEHLFHHREHTGRSLTANPSRAQIAA
jgi:glycosyltransferase involved in cell wall biosynthesis